MDNATEPRPARRAYWPDPRLPLESLRWVYPPPQQPQPSEYPQQLRRVGRLKRRHLRLQALQLFLLAAALLVQALDLGAQRGVYQET